MDHKRGAESLIAAIIVNAIVDGCSHAKPRSFIKLRRQVNRDLSHVLSYMKDRDREATLLNLRALYRRKSVLAVDKTEKSFIWLQLIAPWATRKDNPYRIFKNKVERRQYNERNKKLMSEIFAAETRAWFDENNRMFSTYCWLIDLDPEYVADKVHKFFDVYDTRERKTSIKKLMKLLLNPYVAADFN